MARAKRAKRVLRKRRTKKTKVTTASGATIERATTRGLTRRGERVRLIDPDWPRSR